MSFHNLQTKKNKSYKKSIKFKINKSKIQILKIIKYLTKTVVIAKIKIQVNKRNIIIKTINLMKMKFRILLQIFVNNSKI